MFLLFLVIIIAVVYFLAKPRHSFDLSKLRNDESEEILKKRFVSGEIDEATYKKMLQALRSA